MGRGRVPLNVFCGYGPDPLPVICIDCKVLSRFSAPHWTMHLQYSCKSSNWLSKWCAAKQCKICFHNNMGLLNALFWLVEKCYMGVVFFCEPHTQWQTVTSLPNGVNSKCVCGVLCCSSFQGVCSLRHVHHASCQGAGRLHTRWKNLW